MVTGRNSRIEPQSLKYCIISLFLGMYHLLMCKEKFKTIKHGLCRLVNTSLQCERFVVGNNPEFGRGIKNKIQTNSSYFYCLVFVILTVT